MAGNAIIAVLPNFRDAVFCKWQLGQPIVRGDLKTSAAVRREARAELRSLIFVTIIYNLKTKSYGLGLTEAINTPLPTQDG